MASSSFPKHTSSPRETENDENEQTPHRLPLARRLPDHVRNHVVAMYVIAALDDLIHIYHV